MSRGLFCHPPSSTVRDKHLSTRAPGPGVQSTEQPRLASASANSVNRKGARGRVHNKGMNPHWSVSQAQKSIAEARQYPKNNVDASPCLRSMDQSRWCHSDHFALLANSHLHYSFDGPSDVMNSNIHVAVYRDGARSPSPTPVVRSRRNPTVAISRAPPTRWLPTSATLRDWGASTTHPFILRLGLQES